MNERTATPKIEEQPTLMIVLGWYSIAGCILFVISILIADFVVPDHDWMADTISDLGAGRYEFIVDVGIYSFSASLMSIALLSAHVHLGGRNWSVGIVGFAVLGLIVFLVGARNEYGDNDNEGVVIHVYLVYALGLLMAYLPWAMSAGAARADQAFGKILKVISVVWIISAPVFFFLPNDIDGIYERYLGLVAMAVIVTMAWVFLQRGYSLR